ncbi:hypothetical protein ES702_03193 [subsurface metagenome]
MSSKEETRRSDILVHWTGGKDIDRDYEDQEKPQYYQNSDARRTRYMERLKGTLKGGLWMKTKDVTLYPGPGQYTKLEWPYTSFTEIKARESRAHTQRYGHLGFGFSRKFVVQCSGGPVLYVPGTQELPESIGATPMISQHFTKILRVSEFLTNKTVEAVSVSRPLTSAVYIRREESPVHCKFEGFIKACRLEEFLRVSGYGSDDWRIFAELRGSIITLSVFVKPMSEEGCSYPFELLDEDEWRIPFVNNCEKFRLTGVVDPPYKIPFDPCDLKKLYVPDAETEKLVLADKNILEWSGDNPLDIELVS